VQPAETSIAVQTGMPSAFCTRPASDGVNSSPVIVQATMTPTLSGASPDIASASFTAETASPVAVSSTATWRERMPVRLLIHSSLVSTICARSSLVTTFSGTHLPMPVIETGANTLYHPYFQRTFALFIGDVFRNGQCHLIY